jgi:hypothetical protein
MTTKSSPIQQLRAQADKIAATLKTAERGGKVDARFAEKIAAARANPTFKVGVVMDDKVFTLELPWTKIAETTERELSRFILNLMQEAR